MLAQVDAGLDPNQLAEQADDWLSLAGPYLPYMLGGAFALVAIVLLLRLLRGKGKPEAKIAAPVEMRKLSTAGPPASGPCVELHNVPMRMAVLVLAPIGRGGHTPSAEQIPGIMEGVIPGIKRVIVVHDPLLRTMPPQLSAQGFSNVVFAKLKLAGVDAESEPDAQGKGTAWSMVAGKIDVGGNKLLAAMVLRADKPNGIGGVTLDNENQWLNLIKIRDRA